MDASRELVRALLGLLPDPAVIVDPGGTIVLANAQLERTFGYAPAELVGAGLETLLPECDRNAQPAHRPLLAMKATARPLGARRMLHGRHKDGRQFSVEISLNAVAIENSALVIATVRAAAPHSDNEDKLIASGRQIRRFLAEVSHDLRQPLQTLHLLNRSAKRQRRTSATMLDLLERQQLALDSMSALLASVLDISKLDSGIVVAHPVACAIQDILDRVRADFEPQAADKGLELVIERCVDGVLTDPELLRRLLGNLISNAIRYTQRGGVSISCTRRVDWLAVEVRDTGVGIPPDQLERVFEEFYQVDRGTERREGYGLGLSIVRRLQQLLGCGVRVESMLGKGTTFCVTIPRIELARPAALSSPSAQPSTGGGRVLVVDDEPPMADAMRLLLEIEGFHVKLASSQEEALACARAFSPEIIVTDFRLRGGETGVGIVSAVRSDCDAFVPAIFLTGDTGSSTLPKLHMENSRLLRKPFPADDLLGTLREHISAYRTLK